MSQPSSAMKLTSRQPAEKIGWDPFWGSGPTFNLQSKLSGGGQIHPKRRPGAHPESCQKALHFPALGPLVAPSSFYSSLGTCPTTVTSWSIGKPTPSLGILTKLYVTSEPRIFVSFSNTVTRVLDPKVSIWSLSRKALPYGICAFQQRGLQKKTPESKSYVSTNFHDNIKDMFPIRTQSLIAGIENFKTFWKKVHFQAISLPLPYPYLCLRT